MSRRLGDSFSGLGSRVAVSAGLVICVVSQATMAQDYAWAPLGSGTGGSSPDVLALTVFSNELIAGGAFTTAGGTPADYIASWNGSTWQPVGSGMNGAVAALTIYGNELVAGGSFTTAGGNPANYIAHWDGSTWQPFGSGLGGASPIVFALTVFQGQVIAGGNFTTAGGNSANYIARWNGSTWQSLGSGMNGTIYALTVYNNELIAGGSFTNAGGVGCNRIARWNGSGWLTLGPAAGMSGGSSPNVDALTVFSGERIAGGSFTLAGSVGCNNIAGWNGSAWEPLGSGMTGSVKALTVFNNDLIAGGTFMTAGSVPCSRIARWTLASGACCFGDGSCQVLSPTACAASAGTYQGNWTACDPNPCPQPAACCYPNGSCAVTLQAGCTGVWHSEWADCGAAQCPQPTGSCCQTDGTCTVTLQADCTATWTMFGTCDPNLCEQPTGSCCQTDGSCTVTLEADCTATWTMFGTCTPNMCPQPAACCYANGTCAVTLQANCSGTWHSEWADCGAAQCPQPTGSCCQTDGTCTVTLQADCTATWTMFGTCDPNLCEQPTGSCCQTDGSCTVTLEADCTATWTMFGACDPNLCEQPTGSCCQTDGSCTVTLEADCTATWTMFETCDPNPCPLPTGACCYPNGSCLMIIEPECSGIWHGDWIDCGEDLCPQPGACCFLGETCQLLALDDCAAAGGFFRGENIPCDPGRCSGVGVVELDGAARDPLYEAGIPLAVQIKQTGYGDSTLGRPDWANGSELDAAYGVVYDGNLYLVLAGNLQTNGNTVEIFFDTRPGGQNRLLGTENSDIDYGALRRMGYLDEVSPGLKFAAGFEADYYLTLKANGAPTAVYASYAELYVDALNPGMGSYLGEGRTKCETNDGTLTGGWEGAPAVRCTLDNSNVAGVTGGFGLGDGTGVLTGFELVIPLSAIGSPTSDFAVTVFINSPGHDWVSNQTLGGIAASSPGNLGEPRTLDLEAFGQVPFTVPITPTPVGACCIGTVCSIQTQTACAGAGGVYAGDNASCDGNPCDQVTSGRCCIEDDYSGECLVTTQADCANLGGAYTAGEDCAGCPCLLGPRGACCLNGQCTITRQEDCTASQGVFAGPFSVCDDISCTPGACCIVHDCSALFGFQCSAAGGRYRGDGTTCQEHTCSQTVPTPTVAGTMNGWNTTANPMMETAPNSGIWTVTFSSLLPPGRRDEFKITNGTWSNCIPGSNSWCHTDSNGQVTITYDSNLYADGWAPGWDRIGVSVDSGAWTAAGDWQGWNNANPSTAMVAQGEEGEGIYLYEGTGLEAGKHYWKAVKTGSWDSISWNERSINTADMEFTIGAPTDVFRLWVDALAGRVKVEVWPAQGACCQPNGSCAVTWQADCTGTWHGVGTTCTPTPCPLVNGDLNCDHIVDLNDIPYFTGALLGEYSGCQLGLADMDCDGTVDGLDIAPFVNYLVAGIYPPCTQPPTGMVLIPAGEFLMGDTFTEGDTDEQPVHTVYVDAFHMDTYEVTNHQYCDALNWAYGQGNLIQVTSGVVYQHGGTSYAYCDTTTSSSYSRITWNGTTFGVTAGKANHPMVMVSWYGSVAYANWRSEIQNKPLCYDLSDWTCNFAVAGYRLPTEAEWEKAARGGAAGHRFPWSDQDTIQHARANYYSYAIYGYDTSATRNYHPLWGISPYYPFTSPVGFFTGALRHEADWGWPGSPTSYQTANGANSYGLHDMAGNVWERCNDWYQSDYYSNSPYNDPTGPTSGAYTSRVLRGGGWGSTASGCRVADRYDATPGTRHDTFGFRLALDSP